MWLAYILLGLCTALCVVSLPIPMVGWAGTVSHPPPPVSAGLAPANSTPVKASAAASSSKGLDLISANDFVSGQSLDLFCSSVPLHENPVKFLGSRNDVGKSLVDLIRRND